MAFLAATSRYLPEKIIANQDLTQFPERYRNLIAEKAGILSRHHAEDRECTSDLGSKAVRSLLDKTGLAPKSVSALICATSSPDRIQPPTATRIQALCGLERAFAFDVNAVCSGAIYALRLAASLVKDGVDNVIVVAAEVYSKILNREDITTYPYFGDGAAAALVTRKGRLRLTDFVLGSDGTRADLIQVPGGGTMLPASQVRRKRDYYFLMAGAQVFEFACEAGARVIATLASRNAVIPDRVIAHQANTRIISEVASRSGLPAEKFFVNVQRYANTAAASVLIALDESLEEYPDDTTLLLVVFGGGLSWGGALLQAH
jgi:3-oxoacyl-[acyl-carrier-protein] synthase-3